jgi:farnesyl diphosphate synthase
MGALSAGERAQSPAALDRYAENIGLAFQVQDDILDVVGDTATLGKRQGADQQLGKSTYPALLGLEQARKKRT